MEDPSSLVQEVGGGGMRVGLIPEVQVRAQRYRLEPRGMLVIQGAWLGSCGEDSGLVWELWGPTSNPPSLFSCEGPRASLNMWGPRTGLGSGRFGI